MTKLHLLFSDADNSPQHTLCMAKQGVANMDPVAALSGKRIREGREARSWTQEDLAKATGWMPDKPSRAQKQSLSQSRIANFEQGTRRVGLEEAQILAEALGMPAPYFMGVISDQEAAVLAALRQNERKDPFKSTIDRQAVRAKRA
jgi:transcriptional regulator with XRE-family HTH domain